MSEQFADSCSSFAAVNHPRVLMHLRTPFWPDGRPWAARELPGTEIPIMSEQFADSCSSFAAVNHPRVLMHLRTPFWPDGRPWAARELPAVAVEDRQAYLRALGNEVDARALVQGDCRVAALWVGGGVAVGMADEELGRLLTDVSDRYDLTGDDGRPSEVTVEAYPGLVNERGGVAVGMADEELGRLLTDVSDRYDLTGDDGRPSEVTVEAYPGLVNEQLLDDLRCSGATRLFVDYGTGSPAEARGLGRTVAAEGLPGLDDALRECPLPIEVRLLVGNPGQSVVSALKSLETALGFGAVAVDLQAFLLGAGSSLASERLAHESSWRMDALHRIPGAAERIQIQAELGLVLQDHGFSQYLPGYWAIPGRESFYRLARSAGCDVLGLGLGARTRFEGVTSCNTEDLGLYMQEAGNPEAIEVERWREPA